MNKLTKIIIPIIIIILSLYILFSLEMVETLPETCGINKIIHMHLNCQFTQALFYILPILILVSLVWLIILIKNKQTQ